MDFRYPVNLDNPFTSNNMSKQKTVKAVAKRFKITKNDKVMKKKAGAGHFNARESGKVTRTKRRATQMSTTMTKNIKSFIPHAK